MLYSPAAEIRTDFPNELDYSSRIMCSTVILFIVLSLEKMWHMNDWRGMLKISYQKD